MSQRWKYKAWDWIEKEFYEIPTNDIVEAIHEAWRQTLPLFDSLHSDFIFSGYDSTINNNKRLKKYALQLIEIDGTRRLQDLRTGETYEAKWQLLEQRPIREEWFWNSNEQEKKFDSKYMTIRKWEGAH